MAADTDYFLYFYSGNRDFVRQVPPEAGKYRAGGPEMEN